MACTADKIIEQLIRLFFAILCVGGIYLGLWFHNRFLFRNACPTIKKQILQHIIVFKHLIMQILIQNNCDSVYFIKNNFKNNILTS